MAFKSRNELNFEQSKRFKLYKSGKLWLVTGLSFVSILGGTLLNSNSVAHADTVETPNNSTSSAATSSSASSVNTYVSAATKSTDVNDTDTTQTTSASTSQADTATSTSSSSNESSASTANSSSTSTASSASSSTTNSSSVNTNSNTSSAATSGADSTVATSANSQVATTVKKAAVAAVAESTTTADTWTIGDTSRPRVDVVDVASYQSGMSQSDYNTLKSVGVKTVIVKATEGTTYVNPAAVSEAKMANQAGLNVDFYHYATFNTTTEANAEATNLVTFLTNNSVNKNVLIFADMEDSLTYSVNAEANLNAFWSALDAAGYTNHGVYASKYYAYITAVTNTVGSSRVWMAQYPYSPSSSNLLNTTSGAWQFASTAQLPSGASYTGYLDVSIDYTGLTEDSAGTATFGTSSATTGSTSTGNTSTSTTTTVTSGTYTFTGTTAIKSAASDSASTVGTYYQGSTVNYNAKITANGETWLRYLAASGAQRYVKIGGSTSTSSTSEAVTAIAGTYTFSSTTAIKSAANDSASTVGTYYKGSTVNYNAKITVNGQTWLRYLAASGAQRYVKISGGSTSSSTSSSSNNNSSATTTATAGTYTFTQATAIKSATSDTASTVGTYYKGSTVNYNAKITVNGQTWLRYLAASGAQRYVKVSGSTASSSTSTTNTSTTSAQTGTYTFKATTNIRTAASLSASIVGTYYAGETVHYLGLVSVNGYQWLKYLSASGNYRYVAMVS
ncbi:SH3 domain-containing protein [Lactiplantibacillus daoliensis]|uniref:SH3 domain-containing protein n=1 Tax=Lactiplantibacillus daoliensis TaxID=2559916 RepID=A0ABW1UIA4_9LACO|nr:SH3 domain-containing protein [Lactiplantibacillus daoliensis]